MTDHHSEELLGLLDRILEADPQSVAAIALVLQNLNAEYQLSLSKTSFRTATWEDSQFLFTRYRFRRKRYLVHQSISSKRSLW